MDVFENCPVFEDENFKIRLIEEADADDLFKVYSDKFALPFFNSDNCHGSNFYCAKKEDIENAIKYWLIEYRVNKGFVRFSVVDKSRNEVIGTIEMFNRKANDYFNNCGLLRLDLRSDCEKVNVIQNVLALVVEPFFKLFKCSLIATKGALYAVDRIEALKNLNFIKSDEPLIGHYQTYYDYWVLADK